jgi:hypothetical protein
MERPSPTHTHPLASDLLEPLVQYGRVRIAPAALVNNRTHPQALTHRPRRLPVLSGGRGEVVYPTNRIAYWTWPVSA